MTAKDFLIQSWTILPFPVLAYLWFFVGHDQAIIGLCIVDVVTMLPQLWVTYLSPDITGLSLPTATLRFLSYTGWCIYMILVDKPLLAAYAWVLAPISAAILLRIIYIRTRHSRHLKQSLPIPSP